MSSTDPPQIHITISSNSTSFKRSFEQFGFDLDSPVDANSSSSASPGSNALSAGEGGERSKRPRSDSSSSGSGGSSGSSSRAATGSSSSRVTSESPSLVRSPPCPPMSAAAADSSSSLHPEQPPAHPLLAQEDVEMLPSVSLDRPRSYSPPSIWHPLQTNRSSNSEFSEHFRVSMERFNAFDAEISALRQRSSPPVRITATPPTLPPLSLDSPNLDPSSHVLDLSNSPLPSMILDASSVQYFNEPPVASSNDFAITRSERQSDHDPTPSGGNPDRDYFAYPTYGSHQPRSTSRQGSVRLPVTDDAASRSSARRSHLRTTSPSRYSLSSRGPLIYEWGYIDNSFGAPSQEGPSRSDGSVHAEQPRRRMNEERRIPLERRFPLRFNDSLASQVITRADGEQWPAVPRSNRNTERRDYMGILIPEPSAPSASERPSVSVRGSNVPGPGVQEHDDPQWTIFRNDARRALRANFLRSGRAQTDLPQLPELGPRPRHGFRHGLAQLGAEDVLNGAMDDRPYRSESPDSRSGPRTHPLELDDGMHEEFQPLLSRIDGQSLDTYGDADSQPRRDVRTTQRTSLIEPSSRRESHLRYDFSTEPSPLFGLRSTHLQEGMAPPGRSTPYPEDVLPELEDVEPIISRSDSSLVDNSRTRTSLATSPRSAWRSVPDRLSSESDRRGGISEPSALSRSRMFQFRPSQSNSLMSENAAEWRRHAARSQVHGLAHSLRGPLAAGDHTDRDTSLWSPGSNSLFMDGGESLHRDLLSFDTNSLATADSYVRQSLHLPAHRPLPSQPSRHRPSVSGLQLGGPNTEPDWWADPEVSRPVESSILSSTPAPGRRDPDRAPFSSQTPLGTRTASSPLHNVAEQRSADLSETSSLDVLLPSPPASRGRPVSNPTTSEPRRASSTFHPWWHEPIDYSNTTPPSRAPPQSQAPSSAPHDHRSSVFRNIDLDAYHRGPFRASLERLVEIERLRARLTHLHSLSDDADSQESAAPSLPPLRFDDDDDIWSSGTSRPTASMTAPRIVLERRLNPERDLAGLQRQPRSLSREESTTPATGMWRSINPRSGRRRSPLSSTPNPPAPSSRPSADNTDSRGRRQMHNLFARRPRLEASRIADGDNTSDHGSVEGFSHAIALLRADGLTNERQRQLIDRFQRQRSEDNRRQSSHWGDVEGEDTGSVRPRPLDIRRRFGGSALFAQPPAHRAENARTAELPTEPTDRDRDPQSERIRHEQQRVAANRRSSSLMRHRTPASIRSSMRDELMTFEQIERLIRGRGGHHFAGAAPRVGRGVSDFIRDEDFDTSYESLLSLAATLGDVKPRCTSESVIASLPTGLYRDWATPDSDARCPICLDDYQPTDPVLKLTDCTHWLHKDCLKQWLRGATTCPVCRKHVKGPAQESASQAGPSTNRRDGHGHDNDDDDDDDDDDMFDDSHIGFPWR